MWLKRNGGMPLNLVGTRTSHLLMHAGCRAESLHLSYSYHVLQD